MIFKSSDNKVEVRIKSGEGGGDKKILQIYANGVLQIELQASVDTFEMSGNYHDRTLRTIEFEQK